MQKYGYGMPPARKFNFDEVIELDINNIQDIYDLVDHIKRNHITIHTSDGKGKESDDFVMISRFEANLLVGRSKITIHSAGNHGVIFHAHDGRLPKFFKFFRVEIGSEKGMDMVIDGTEYIKSELKEQTVKNEGFTLGVALGEREVEVPTKYVATDIQHHAYHLVSGAPLNSTVNQYTKIEKHTKKVVSMGEFESTFVKALKKIHQKIEGKISFNNNRYKDQIKFYEEKGISTDNGLDFIVKDTHLDTE